MIKSNKQIQYGAILSYLGVAIGILSGLFYNPWMIKNVGASDYGLYTLAMSLINTFLFDFGLSIATQRFISGYVADGNKEATNNTAGLMLKMYMIMTAILAILFLFLYFFLNRLYPGLTPEELLKFKGLYILVAIYSITSFPFIPLKGIMSAYERFVPLKMCELLYKLLSVGLTICALLFGYGIFVLVLINIISSVFVTGIRVLIIRKSIPISIKFSYWNIEKVKSILSFSIYTSISATVMRLFLTLGPSILGQISNSFEIAVFGYAVSIEAYIYACINAINGFFMPKLSRYSRFLDKKQENEQVLELMISVGRFILCLYVLIFVGLATMGEDFILLTVGEDFLNSYQCTLLICAYGIVAYPQQIANTYAIVMNRVKTRAIISVLAMAVYIVTAFPLGKELGAIGVCLAVCLALITQTVLFNVMYYKELQIDIGKFFEKCYLKNIPTFLFFIVQAVIISQIGGVDWISFFIKVGIIIIMFIVDVWIGILNSLERKIIMEKIKC